MPTLLLEPTTSLTQTDADLVAASRRGDREAFGRIVRRYQGMVTGITYAACGDLHRSEDLAQETFISAWKSLSGLREPAKLPAWLCQVARHRLLDDARSESRHDARVTRAFQSREEATSPSPAEQVLSDEERDLLWATLREIPQPYRETMVLFYRQGKSAEDVAAAMETTEANVRQRLTRGRSMLREQVAAMLERNLGRSAPSAAFAVAVVAALPALVAPQAAAAAAMTAATVKGSAAAAKGTGLIALLTFWIGPIIGLAGGVFGTWASIRATQHPRERRFVVRMAVLVWIFVIVSMGVLFGLMAAQRHYRWSGGTSALVQSAFWATYGALLVTFVLVSNRRQAQIRKEEGLPPPQRAPKAGDYWWVSAMGGVGAVSWMIGMAGSVGDTRSVVIASAFAVGLVLASRVFVRGRPVGMIRRFALVQGLAIGAFTMVMVNWRLHTWIAKMTGTSLAETYERIPLWAANVLAGVLSVFVLALVAVTIRARPDEDEGASKM